MDYTSRHVFFFSLVLKHQQFPIIPVHLRLYHPQSMCSTDFATQVKITYCLEFKNMTEMMALLMLFETLIIIPRIYSLWNKFPHYLCSMVKLLFTKCQGRAQPKNCLICVLVLSCVNLKNLKAVHNKMEDWHDREVPLFKMQPTVKC